MADYQIRGRMNLETGQFIGALNGAESALKKFQNSNDNANKKVAGFGRILRTVATGALAAYVVKLGVDSVKAAQAAGAAQDRLRRLLLNTGGATEAQIGLLNQQAQALEALTVVSDDNITTVQSQLATFDLAAGSIATLTPAILDYVVAERGAGASADEFRSLTNGLAQALNGQFASLTRVGFVLDDATKKQIASGTEAERADAIVRVLNSTYKNFAQTAGGTAAGAQIKLKNEIDNVREAFGNALLPTIQKVQGFIATNLIPIFQNLQARFADGSSVQRFVDFIAMLGKNIIDFGKAIIQIIGPVFTTVFLPVIKLAIGAVIAFIKVIGAIGRFIQNNIKVFQVLAGVITAVAIGIGAYILQVKILNGVSKVMLFLTNAKAIATGKLTKAFKALNLVMKMNPIGFIIGAVAALAAGFVMLWNKSEAFRKLVIEVGKVGLKAIAALIRGVAPFAEAVLKFMTTPIRSFLKVLSYIPGVGKYFKSALDVANKALDGTSEFLDKAADKVEGLANSLDKYSKKKVKAPTMEKPKGPEMPDLSGLGRSDKTIVDDKAKKAAEDAAKKLREMKAALTEAVQEWEDWMRNDFTKSFLNGADSARDAVMSALDKTKAVFDAQAKMLSGEALTKLEQAWTDVNNRVRMMVTRYAEVAGLIEAKQKEIDKAYDALQEAIKSRSEGQKKFFEVLAKPFGEPSELTKALSSAEASIDSIISMYDKLVEAVNQRFEGFDPKAKNIVIDFIKAQTTSLIALAKKREKAIEKLQKAKDDLADLVAEQEAFIKDSTSSLKSFSTSLTDLSKTQSQTVIDVIKTSTGYLIKQIRTSGNAMDKITADFKNKLETIRKFSSNIKALLGKGLNKDYVRSLITAGPESAGAIVEALMGASQGQLDELNSLYSQINETSTTFGDQMGSIFYDASVKMAEGVVKGAQDELDAINSAMTLIKDNISTILAVLADEGLKTGKALADGLLAAFSEISKKNLNTAAGDTAAGILTALTALTDEKTGGAAIIADMAQAMYDKLEAEGKNLVALAQSIATAIMNALASAAGSIGVKLDVPEFADMPNGSKDGTSLNDNTNALDALNAQIASQLSDYAALSQTRDDLLARATALAKQLAAQNAATTAPSVGLAARNGLMRPTPTPSPSPKPAPLPQNTRTNLPSSMKSAPGATEIRNATVVVNTTKPPSASQIKNTVSGALAGAANAKKGK